ncbi:MAG: hypothetical protein ACHQRJ_01820 [Alphaproteobacteria bacterium]
MARYWLWILIPAVLLLVVPLLTPGAIYYWSFRGFRSLFHDDLGLGNAWSSVLSFVCAFVYAVALPLTLRWLVFGRRRVEAFFVMMIVFGTTPLLHAFFDKNFNQTTGEAQKYYAVQPNGDIVLSDNPGFDPSSGVKRRPVTRDVAEIIERQKKGLRAQPVMGDPHQLTFFDAVTGQPQIWYYKNPTGRYELFDAAGFFPGGGEELLPVTRDVVTDIYKESDAEHAQKGIEAKEEARKQLVELFGVESYAPGVVIVGARARDASDGVSAQAAKRLLSDIIASLRKKGVAADELKPNVYGSSYFDALMRGESAVLADVGLAQKMRATVLALVDATCQQAASVSGLTSCTVVAHLRMLKSGSRNTSSSEWSETGAGTSRDDAIARATELLIERHPGLLDGA